MIKSIKIEIDGEDIDLSMEDARKLYADLGEVFKQPYTHYVYPPVFPRPYETTWTSNETSGGLVRIVTTSGCENRYNN